jgi:hypothetical protein
MIGYLADLARRVKRGAKLLDRKVPNWRKTMREHEDQYEFENGDCCILGTLEHYNGRMKQLKMCKRDDRQDLDLFNRAAARLRIHEVDEYGFEAPDDCEYYDYDEKRKVLEELWRAEFSA